MHHFPRDSNPGIYDPNRDTTARAELGSFPDGAKVSGYAVEPMSWAVASGLITGSNENGKTYLLPVGTTTRAQYATIIYRFLEK